MSNIDISGLDKARVLATLYNSSRPQGLGFMHYTPADMTEKEAQEVIKEYQNHNANRLYFDYLKGRVMKVDLTKDSFSPALFDRDNGQGAAALAIERINEVK